jgi:ELWxxDGT repeat protein
MIRQTILFSGSDANAIQGLWETNGTGPGTQEVTDIGGADPTGVFPQDLTAFDGEVLFNGGDSSGNHGLWITNGAAAGTSELTGISGAAANLNPSSMLVFNGAVLFRGTDASGQSSLWMTNGTAAGTHELTGIGGASTSGIFSSTVPSFAVFNGEVLFAGTDTGGVDTHKGLWVTNGTAAGTSEITGIGNTPNNGGDFGGLDPFDLTAFNGEVLFSGTDAANHLDLWVTNGTANGTFELDVAGENTGNDFDAGGLEPGDITVFNSEVLFQGLDSSNNWNLWVSNGTGNGTHELTGISGAYSGGVVSDLTNINPLGPDFTVLNGKVLFTGSDADGSDGLWVTNGTVAGTSELAVSGAWTGAPADSTRPTWRCSAARSCSRARTPMAIPPCGRPTARRPAPTRSPPSPAGPPRASMSRHRI